MLTYKDIFNEQQKDYEGFINELSKYYKFDNIELLHRALIPEAKLQIDDDKENFNALKEIGVKAFDLVLIKFMKDYYGNIDNEGNLVNIKDAEPKNFFNKAMHSSIIDYLDEFSYLKEENRSTEYKDRENIFLALVGAIAIDSCWNIEILSDVIKNMNVMWDDVEVRLIQTPSINRLNSIFVSHGMEPRTRFNLFDGFIEDHEVEIHEEGRTSAEAKNNAAEQLYDELNCSRLLYADKNVIANFISGNKPSKSNADMQVAALVNNSIISQPEYDVECDWFGEKPVKRFFLMFKDVYWGEFDCSVLSNDKYSAKVDLCYKLLRYLFEETERKKREPLKLEVFDYDLD